MSRQANGNAALYFVDENASDVNANKVAFVEGDGAKRTLTYSQLGEQSGRMSELYANHGISAEARAAMLILDQIEFPIIFWGSLKAGIIPVPLNTLLATDVYDTILRNSKAQVLFVSEALLPTVELAIKDNPFLKAVFVIGATEKFLNFENEITSCSSKPTCEASSDETAFWLYSSGSTGQPKGVRHVHESLKCTADTYGADVLQIKPDDIVYSAAKFFFAYGLGNAMTFPMSVGATTILLSSRPTPQSVIDILNQYKPTIFCGVPTLYAALVAHINSGKGALEMNLRKCISAGEALPEEVGKTWEAISGTEILDGVGSTEMLHIFLSNQSGSVKYGTSGTAVPGYEIKLVNENDEEVGVGEIGELLVKGNSSASDYWNQRKKTRDTFQGVWTRTGDKYEKRDDGYLTYCGRTDDMFKVSGIWVSPFEVEQALSSHVSVLEAAVVPARDAENLEKPKAFVVLNEGIKTHDIEVELKEYVKGQIGKWKYPRWVEIVSDLPKTATGKIQRFKLREDNK